MGSIIGVVSILRSGRGLTLGACLSAVAMSIAPAAAADPSGRLYFDRFAGVMTENPWEQVLDPTRVQFADSYLVGVGIGWDRRIGQSRFRFGPEIQAVGHVGRQDHLEFNVLAVLRYLPPRPFPRQLKTVSYGLGLSHATKVPQVEVDRSGASQRNFFYWYGELEFSLPDPDASMFLRLHHRSDGFGAFEVDSGSTGVTLGLRIPM